MTVDLSLIAIVFVPLLVIVLTLVVAVLQLQNKVEKLEQESCER